MNNPSPSSSPSFFKLLTSALLSYTLLMTPLASVAAANVRSGVPAGSAATAKAAAESPALPAPAPAPEEGRASAARGAQPASALAPAALLAPLVGAVTATMTAAVSPNDGDGGKIDPTTGVPATTEKITYTATLSNSSASDGTGLTFSVPLDTHTSLVPGSLNSTPVAFDVSVTTNEDTGVSITLAGQDPDGSNLTFTNIGSPTHGSLGSWSAPSCSPSTGVCTSSATYTPAADYFGSDGFTFKVNDGTAPSNESGTVSITVNGVNDVPTFTAGVDQTVNEDAGAQSVSNFITNVRPAQPGNTTEDTQTVSFEITNNTNPSLFSSAPALNVAGAAYPKTATLTYTPALNQNGEATITYRAKDNGGTNFGGVDTTATSTFKITVNAVNDKPTVVAPTGIVVQANMKRIGLGGLLANVSDVDNGVNGCVATPFKVKSGSISATTPAGGTFTNVDLNAGTFDFDPPPGFTGGNVTFTYVVTDNGCPGTADSDPVTVSIAVQGPVIWFVNPALASDGDGRLSNPFKLLQSAVVKLNSLAANQRIFVYAGTTEVMAIPAGQQGTPNTVTLTGSGTQAAAHWLIGAGALGSDFDTLMGLTGGLAVPANTIARPSINAATRPVVRSTVLMKDNTVLRGLDVNVTAAAAGSKGVTNGAIGGTSTIEISDVDVTSGSGNAVDFSSGQTVNFTGSNNDITSGTGIALNVANTTIGASNFNFKSITAGTAASGPSSGIVLNNTGATGSLIVSGGGNSSQGGDASGGTIQKTSGAGIVLTSTKSPSFNNIKVLTTTGSGIDGTGVNNFTLTNSNLTGNGSSGVTDSSNIAFNDTATANVTGTITVTNNILNTGFYHGVDIFNVGGTIDNATISNNLIVSDTNGALSLGSGIRLIGFGNAAVASVITKATLDSNNIQNFPSGAGITIQGGNSNSTSAPPTTMGVASHATNKINVTNNLIKGQSAANRIGVYGIQASVNGRGQGNFNISNNGTAANPITNVAGNVISHSALGFANVTTTIANNVIVANHTAGVGGALGISVGVGRTFAVTDSASLSVSITGNTVSQTDANGILARAVEGQSTMNISVKNNTVAAPLSGVRPGIRVDSGTSEAGTNANVCLDISGNTSAGSGGTQGLGLRKQGTSTSVNIYGVKGMAATATPGVETFVNGQNPAGNGTLLISATSGFSNCSTSPDAPLGPSADAAPKTQKQQSLSSGRSVEEMRALVDADEVRAPDRTPEMQMQSQAPAGSASLLKFTAPFIAPLLAPAATAPEADRAAVEATHAPAEANRTEAAQAAAAPARVWSDMPAGSESAAANVADVRDDDSAQYGARVVGASYERPASERADAPVGDAVATAVAAAPAPETTTEEVSRAAAVYASMAHSLLVAAFFSGDIVTVSGVNNAGFTLPVGRTVTVTFQATLNNPPNLSGPTSPQVSAQGTLNGAFAGNPLLTDDTSVGGANDPTVTPVDLFNTTSAITGASPSSTTNTTQPVTLTATITPNNTPAPAGGTLPGGTATFKDNGVDIAGCVLVTVTSGQAQCTTSALSTGTHNNITVDYKGDGNFDPSSSAAFTQTVSKSNTTISVTSAPGPNPSFVNQSVTYTATVASATSVAGPPTGTVVFKDGGTTISGCGSVSLSSGTAQCTNTPSTSGSHVITVFYNGDDSQGRFNASDNTASPFTQVVNASGTNLVVSSSLNPSLVSQAVTFTATINSTTAVTGPPAGTIQFWDGPSGTGTALGSPVTLTTGGSCPAGKSCASTSAISNLTAGTHTITADYINTDGAFSANSSTLPGGQVVNKSGTATALTTSGSPSVPAAEVTFTATVTSTTAVTGPPTGTVTFFDGASPITCSNAGGQTLSAGVATCKTSSLSVAVHSITAQYNGDDSQDRFNTSTSPVVQQTVGNPCTTTIVVMNTNDSGTGSLREAISNVCDDGTITFDASAFAAPGPHTITLAQASGPLAIAKSLTIQGPGSGIVTVSGNDQIRVFTVASGISVNINGLTVTKGKAPDGTGGGDGENGGAIFNSGTLTLTGVVVSNSNAGAGDAGGAGGYGGGIFNAATTGTLFLVNSTVRDNKSGPGGSPASFGGGGGGIFNLGSLTVNGSTISGNQALGLNAEGGGLDSEGGTATLINSTLSGNVATGAGGGFLNCGDSNAVLTNVTVTNNRSDNDNDNDGDGGGIGQVSSGTLTLNNTIVAGNYKGNAVGVKQSETITVVGTANVNGNIIVRVTAAGMSNSPKNVTVAVADLDSASAVANKIVSALTADSDVGAASGFFDVSIGTNPEDVVLTVKTAAANDPTMHVKLFGNTTGIQTVDSSPSATGVPPVSAQQQVETLKLTGGPVANCTSAAGTVTVTVTANGMNGGSPVAVQVPVADADDTSAVAGKIRDFLVTSDPQAQIIAGFFDIGGTGANVTFTKKTAEADDGTLEVTFSPDSPCDGISAESPSDNTTPGVDASSGTQQQETVVVSGGPVANDGTIQVKVTASALSVSPKTVPVTVTAGESDDTVAINIASALNADTDINGSFTAGSSGPNVTLTANTAAANDGSMKVSIIGNATGIEDAESTQTPGVFQSASDIEVGGPGPGAVSGSFNLIGTGGTGGLTNSNNNQINVDPTTVFAAGLANNGGPTQTIALNTSGPAIDTGSGALTALTTLSAGINAVVTTVAVNVAGSIPADYGYTIRVENEQMVVTAKSGNDLTVTRGANGTTAATHASGASVYAAVDQRGFQRPVDSSGTTGAGDESDIGAYEAQVKPNAPNAPDLDAASDTGASNTDNVTGDSSPTFTISGVIPGATVELLRGGSPLVPSVTGVAAGTSIQLTDPNAPTSATPYVYSARQTVGGAPTSDESATLSVTIDTSAPGTPGTPNLQDASDTGVSNTDNITNATSRVFDVSGTDGGTTVELLRDTVPSTGATVVASTAGGGTVQLTDSTAAADGTYAYSSRQTNGVGASTPSAGSLNVTIDTTAPSAPSAPDLQAGSDSGNTTDNITNAASRAFDIGGTTSGVRVELYRGATFVAFATGNGAAVTITDSGAVSDGPYNYTARQVDTAGNFADSSALPVVLDTVSAPATPDLQAGSDSGSSSTDNITKTTPRAFDIASTENGATVELLRGGSPVASTAGTGGTVTLSDTSGALADNTYAYATRQTDVAGNVGTSGSLNVKIDTTAPSPNAPDLDAASDTGTSSTDNRTSAATPHVFNIAIAEAGSKVELLRGGTPVANTTGTGTVQLNDTDALADGTYQYSTRETDVAGNVATSSDLAVTIDTTAPSVSSSTRADADPTSAASVNFTVTFSEAVTGVDAADFATSTSGSISGTSVTNVSGSGTTYTVTVSTGTGDGTIRLDVVNNGTIKDAMNLALGAGFTTGAVYIVDRSNPTVSSITRAGGSPTGAASVNFTVTFSEPVSGVDTADFATVNGGSVTGTSVSGVLPASGPSKTYTVAVSTGSGTPGTVGLNLVDNDSIVDVVSKPLGGAGAGNGNFTGEVYAIDKTPPNTSVVYAGVDNPAHGPTSSAVVNFTVTFTKSVTGFDSSDITLGGTAGATVANVSGSGTTYTVGVEGMTTSGTITVAVGAGVATDDAGNGNNASGTASVNFVPDNFSAFVVNTTADTTDGKCDALDTNDASKNCTLREAIAAANADFGAETITFDATVFAAPGPYTINLGGVLPDLSSDMTITGPGAKVLTVKRNVAGPFRIFYVHGGSTGVTVQISGLTADSGNAANGGGNIRVGDTATDIATLTLTRVAVKGGTGSSFGGGLAVLNGSTLNVIESTVSGNQTTAGDGGGIYNDTGGTLSLVNSTVSGNSAAANNGGGIYANGTTTLSNSTVAGNNANAGGGLYRNGGTFTLKSTIVGDDTAATANTEDLSGTFTSGGFNLIEKVGTATVTPSLSTDITGQDAALRPLADNNAQTQTHSLQCTSPAIDKGNAFGQTTDQRGLGRIFDLADGVFPNAAGGDGSDIGALETQSGGGCLPAAIAPTPSTNEDTQSGTITLTGTYSQNAPLTFSITQTPGHGTLTALSAPSCTYDSGNSLNTCTATLKYTPSLNFNGLDTFKFKVSTSGGLESESADVNVTVNPVNDAPVATPQSVATDEDTPLGITLSGTDVEGSTLTFTVVTNPSHGTLSGTAPDVTYTPAANYNGPDSFTFRVNDGALNSADSTIAITVDPVNDAPVAVNDTYDASENTPLSIAASTGVVKNDTDVENQTLKAVLFASPTHAASFALSADGSFTYTPEANFVGNDTFTYRADDSSSLNNLSNLATVTIKVNAGGLFQFSAATYSAPENDGTATITVTRTGGSSGAASVNYATAAGGTATGAAACAAGVDYVNASGTLNWANGDTAPKTFAVTICDDTLFELDKTVNLALSGAGGSGELGSQTTATLTITDGDAPGGVFSFGLPLYTVGERDGFATITVTRTGDTTRAANVDYTTDDGADPHVPVPCSATTGSALERCDYTASFGTLRFAAGDTSKTFVVLITDDSYVEGTETTALKLSNPTDGGALALSGGAAAALQIQDDVPESAGNRNDDDASFVTEHYHDFLGRHPDAAGLQFWTQGITSCGADEGCRKVKRINTSAAFFLSIEFQNTGFYAYRVHKAAMGDEQGTFTDGQGTHQIPVPAIRLRQFLRDSRAVGQGVVVGQGNWQAQIETNKRALALEVVQRPGFLARYPTQTSATAFVASLDSNTGGVLTDAQRSSLIQQLSANPADPALRAEVLRTVAETEPFQLAEKNRAFVLMQYYGYLRRNPNDAPEAGLDYSGYVYWLNKLNQFNGNFIDAEMVKAFLESIEYRQRFGQ